ncbi:MAG: hypothetical protein CMF59_17380 [Leptospiraceae bacterium]|nr:hypothetical protein [Leptospiraceae bacterium]
MENRIKALLQFIRQKFNRSLGALIMVMALTGWLSGWIRGVHAFVLLALGIAIFLYRKPEEIEEPELNAKEAEPVVIAQSANYALIQIWAEALHEEGIPTETRDEFMGSILTQPGRSYSEIKLLVPLEFQQRALDILQSGGPA